MNCSEVFEKQRWRTEACAIARELERASDDAAFEGFLDDYMRGVTTMHDASTVLTALHDRLQDAYRGIIGWSQAVDNANAHLRAIGGMEPPPLILPFSDALQRINKQLLDEHGFATDPELCSMSTVFAMHCEVARGALAILEHPHIHAETN